MAQRTFWVIERQGENEKEYFKGFNTANNKAEFTPLLEEAKLYLLAKDIRPRHGEVPRMVKVNLHAQNMMLA